MRASAPLAVVALISLGLAAAALLSRPLLTPDETRVVSVAWSMWLRGDWLVPHLNGLPYSHKPPLLEWLILAGWQVFGVSEWWARVLPALLALAGACLLPGIARRLWPAARNAPALAPLLLAGALPWAIAGTTLLYDLLLTLCVVLALYGMLMAWRDDGRTGWLIFGCALGLGILAKGPVVLLHGLLPAVLAPLWARESHSPRARWKRWYGGIAAATALGVAIAGAWAIPAALAGGPAYADAILWRQTAGRVASSFAHARPLWWYVPLIPLLLFPWFAWPRLWQAARTLRRPRLDDGSRLLLLWLGADFAVFSAISGKQIHYLLPLLPGAALLAARALENTAPGGWRARCAMGGLVVAAGIAVIGAPWLQAPLHLPPAAREMTAAWGWLVAAAGMTMMLSRARDIRRETAQQALAFAVALAGMMAALAPLLQPYDLRPIAREIAALQGNGVPLAHLNAYEGQFDFAGRLRAPLTALDAPQIPDWFAQHPDGRLITYFNSGDARVRQALFQQPYRFGVVVAVVRAGADLGPAP